MYVIGGGDFVCDEMCVGRRQPPRSQGNDTYLTVVDIPPTSETG